MLNRFLSARWLPILLLFALSCVAAGPGPAQLTADDAPQGWPRTFDARDSKIVVYEPQLESFRGNRMTSRAAVSFTRSTLTDPVFGAIWLESTLTIDAEAKTAVTDLVRITEVRFPTLGADEAARLRHDIAGEMPRWNLSYSLDDLHAQLRLIEEQKAAAEGLKADAPIILFRTEPAVLLEIPDQPAWRPSAGSSYERLENCAAFVARDPESGLCYLRIAPFWWTAKDPLGAWQPIEKAPDAVESLARTEPQADPGREPRRPEVIPVTDPTELVWTDGAPQYAPITGTNLLFLRNTDSDVFLDTESQFTYALFSGRWFRRPASQEAWEFVASDQLPGDFARIPVASEKHHVLACVAGTAQARDAVKNTAIPQTEAVKPGAAPELQATYDGEPQYVDVPEAGVQYVVNTPYSIFRVENRYYWCYDGIWYDSAYYAGPWFVCSFVPRPIYRIPPSCPHYYVTYCHVFGSSPGAVYVGYYPGYLGCYAWRGSVVFGTGWRYRSWTGAHCYARPVTWGVSARYNPRSCDWSFRSGVSVSVSTYRRSPSGRGPVVHAGVGGSWGGGTTHPGGGVSHYRHAAPPPSAGSRPNLYGRQPDRRAPNPGTAPSRGYREAPRRETQPPPIERRETPKAPPPAERERRDVPRRETQPPPVEKRETPKVPREVPKRNPQPPPPVEKRETPKSPPVEKREAPKTPPPAERDRRDVPRRDPQPPPAEKRETPKRQPPQGEQRQVPKDPPRQPPPPPRENREAPRREPQKSPPGPQQDRRR